MAEALPTLQPYAQYFVARCLITGGDRRGVEALLDLLDTGEGAGAAARQEIQIASRKLLARLSRTWVNAGEHVWRDRFRELSELTPRGLPVPPVGGYRPRD